MIRQMTDPFCHLHSLPLQNQHQLFHHHLRPLMHLIPLALLQLPLVEQALRDQVRAVVLDLAARERDGRLARLDHRGPRSRALPAQGSFRR